MLFEDNRGWWHLSVIATKIQYIWYEPSALARRLIVSHLGASEVAQRGGVLGTQDVASIPEPAVERES